MADSDRDYSKVKPIKLAPWNAEEFFLGQRTVTLTFRIHGVWSIVNGTKPMPIPPTPPTPTPTGDNTMGITTPADASFTRSLEDWRRHNKLACEALVTCVKGHELRHISVMENALICGYYWIKHMAGKATDGSLRLNRTLLVLFKATLPSL